MNAMVNQANRQLSVTHKHAPVQTPGWVPRSVPLHSPTPTPAHRRRSRGFDSRLRPRSGEGTRLLLPRGSLKQTTGGETRLRFDERQERKARGGNDARGDATCRVGKPGWTACFDPRNTKCLFPGSNLQRCALERGKVLRTTIDDQRSTIPGVQQHDVGL